MRIPAKTADPNPGDADGTADTLASGKLRPHLPGRRPLVLVSFRDKGARVLETGGAGRD
jgi:hypothetical protein